MSTETRPRVFKGIIDLFKALGSTDTIEYDSEVGIMHPMLIEALENIEKGKLKKEAEQAANVTGGSNRSNRAKLNKTYKAEVKDVSSTEMSKENLEKMIKTLNGDEKEIVDD